MLRSPGARQGGQRLSMSVRQSSGTAGQGNDLRTDIRSTNQKIMKTAYQTQVRGLHAVRISSLPESSKIYWLDKYPTATYVVKSEGGLVLAVCGSKRQSEAAIRQIQTASTTPPTETELDKLLEENPRPLTNLVAASKEKVKLDCTATDGCKSAGEVKT